MNISTAYKSVEKHLHYYLPQFHQAVTESVNKPTISKSYSQQQNN